MQPKRVPAVLPLSSVRIHVNPKRRRERFPARRQKHVPHFRQETDPSKQTTVPFNFITKTGFSELTVQQHIYSE